MCSTICSAPASSRLPPCPWPQWLPPMKPMARMPAAMAALTPFALSSITVQSPGMIPSDSAAKKIYQGRVFQIQLGATNKHDFRKI